VPTNPEAAVQRSAPLGWAGFCVRFVSEGESGFRASGGASCFCDVGECFAERCSCVDDVSADARTLD
jgi:hypothetical protein